MPEWHLWLFLGIFVTVVLGGDLALYVWKRYSREKRNNKRRVV